MSLENNSLGQNITLAVNVLIDTYTNLETLFAEMDRIGEEEGFITLTPRFMRWKTDTNPSGWLTSNMIKLYQIENDQNLPNLPDIKSGQVFGVEVDLNSMDYHYPVISLISYTFDFSFWTRMPSVSDHWIFWGPFREDDYFDITEENGVWRSKTYEKAKKRYWGMENATGIDIPLVKVTSPESVREMIFQKLVNLPK